MNKRLKNVKPTGNTRAANTQLSVEDVRAIRRALKAGERRKDVAQYWGMGVQAIGNIERRDTWWWVPEEVEIPVISLEEQQEAFKRIMAQVATPVAKPAPLSMPTSEKLEKRARELGKRGPEEQAAEDLAYAKLLRVTPNEKIQMIPDAGYDD